MLLQPLVGPAELGVANPDVVHNHGRAAYRSAAGSDWRRDRCRSGLQRFCFCVGTGHTRAELKAQINKADRN
jgi:hypothetical protein